MKIFVRGDGKYTWATVEMFVKLPESFNLDFERFLRALKSAAARFAELMQERLALRLTECSARGLWWVSFPAQVFFPCALASLPGALAFDTQPLPVRRWACSFLPPVVSVRGAGNVGWW